MARELSQLEAMQVWQAHRRENVPRSQLAKKYGVSMLDIHDAITCVDECLPTTWRSRLNYAVNLVLAPFGLMSLASVEVKYGQVKREWKLTRRPKFEVMK
jgi:hypothetical protein